MDVVREWARLMALFVLVLCLAAATVSSATGDEADNVRKWQKLEYGMFIHFGLSTFTGREHDPGDGPSSTYAPTDLDVDQWIRVAKDAGMNYAVLTAKHVPGHCLWDSKVQWRGKEFDYDVATSGNKTDVVAEFVNACKKYRVAPGLYWCLLDWRNNSVPASPQWTKGDLPDDFFQLAKDQFAELIERYPEVGFYWIDIPRAASLKERQALYDHIKQRRPGTVVLFNHGTARPGVVVDIARFQAAWPTDVLNTERHAARPGAFKPELTWQDRDYVLGYEHCDTIRKCWFWHPNDGPRPAADLGRLYHQVRQAGGNLLLNVPPDRTGRIEERDVATLMEIKRLIDNPPSEPVSLDRPATASNVYKNQSQYGPAAAVDGLTSTRWATDNGATNAWLAVDLGKPTTFDRAVIMAAYPELDRIRAFRIEVRDGGTWKTAHEGGRIGASLEVRFDPVTAQHVRLDITEATDGPTIWEFQLYEPGK